ncbi:MAG: Rrf2 family transcriptional regulator [Oscillospiraceae bacterium]|nr:Rrf2 family transcriptional regulator [Oscillospiraceae bacterium]
MNYMNMVTRNERMLLQVTTDNAIQILRHLHENPGAHRAQSIAKAIGITSPLFTRIAARLKHSGFVAHAPGRQGGYTIGRPATEISFYDVFAAMEGELNISPRLNSDGEYENRDCKLYEFLQTLQSNIVEDMLGVSVADLV